MCKQYTCWVFAGIIWLFGMTGLARAQSNSAASIDLIAQGRYLATAADCIACHTAPNGRPMAGGLPINTPFGRIFSSNITPSKKYGIGNYTEAQFARAVRNGINAKGAHLYPAMPYSAYAGITDDDIKALYAYFMHGVRPADIAAPVTKLALVFRQRKLIAAWNILFVHGKHVARDASKSAAWNRGRYLVVALGHCSACHTPRDLAMAEKKMFFLAGGQINGWRAPNITSDRISGIGGWTQGELVQYLRTGSVPGKGWAAGEMATVIQDSLQYLSAADLNAIAIYLKDSPPIRDAVDRQPAYTYGDATQNYEAGLRATNPGIGYRQPGLGYERLNSGAQLYSAYCASCHQVQGTGTPDGAYPSLIHNSTLGRNNADNLVKVMLSGADIRIRNGARNEERMMPSFVNVLNDVQMARLATFVMRQFGNPRVRVTAKQVEGLRNRHSFFPYSIARMATIHWLTHHSR